MKKNAIFISGGLLVMALALFFAYGCINNPPTNGTIEVANLSYKIGLGSNPALGNANALITIVEFTDYQCPYCERHATQTFPRIESDYINASKVKYYLRDYLIHSNSKSAAAAARCAGDQGKYWDMHTMLFAKQAEWQDLSPVDLAAAFKGYAVSLGVNDAQFGSCYASGRFDSQIASDMQDGKSYGITGTPSSIVLLPKTTSEAKIISVLKNHQDYVKAGYLSAARDPDGIYVFFIKGAFPYDVFKEVLDL